MGDIKLNPSQSQAVDYTDGPLLILAGPGSGKTLTITEKVVNIVDEGFSPDRILALTFSEKAAGEMEERIENRIGESSGITVSTFHSYCNDLLKEFSLYAGINQGTRLISQEHSHVWGINNIDSFGFENIAIPNRPYDLITSLLEGVSQLHDHLVGPQELQEYVKRKLDENIDEQERDDLLKLADLARFYSHYQEYKRDHNFMDYDDMISMVCRLLESNEVVRNQIRNRYDYVLVDEFQDTNYAQLYLINLIADGTNLTCVADDDQCIYRFRGAYLSNIKQLQDYYASLEKIPLDRNYRSSSQIVQLSQQLIATNPEREDKTLHSHNGDGEKIKVVKTPDDTSEANWVADEIQRLIEEENIAPDEIFVLTRKRADGKKYSDALKGKMIPVEYVGNLQLKNYPIVQEALAYMHIVADPFNNGIAFARILAREGVSEHDLQKINTMAKKLSRETELEGDGIYSVLQHYLDDVPIIQKALVKSILTRLNELIDYRKNHLPSDTVKYLLSEKTDLYKSQLLADTFTSRRNIHILNSLTSMVEDLELVDGGSEFARAVEYLELVFNLDIGDEETSEENTVKVMTIHQSKGKEAKVVFVCDLADRHLPLRFTKKQFRVPRELEKGVQRDVEDKILHLEEERRLAYVAMTRAREKLYLTFPEKYAGNKRGVKPSEFVTQLDYESNPLIEYIETDRLQDTETVVTESPLKKKQDEYLRLMNMYAGQGQMKQALESLVVLTQLKEIEDKGNLAVFNIEDFLKTTPRDIEELEALVNEEMPPLVDSDMRFSASKVRQYMECPLKFKYSNVLNIPIPQKTFFQTGTDVHSVFEQLSRYRMQGKSIDMELANRILDETWDGSVFDSQTHEQQELDRVRQMLEYWFEFEKSNVNETIAVEEKFNLKLDGAQFGGVIDRIDQTPEGEYIVIDYKTSKSPLSKNKMPEDVQLALYCQAVRERYGKYPVKAGLMYVNPNIRDLRLMDVNQSQINSVLDGVREIVADIKAEDFEIREEPNCYFCDYKGICEWYNHQ
ncbi:ATP-dependent helicase [Methanohalophilus mahii]|uniref:DNA 3'-5' helicase n=1 Tax=Methanohalophilus mahii (strain ATCC 35705 / DSM 5219 / SLP) TaxID=547558 RepID=D5EBL4_METMS|nr:ATP-dependent DNA helicase [Methanohalophilus mahii]ADE36565.1 UvrD/REP helicase [Methanohalophilus mahii DSM 5219]